MLQSQTPPGWFASARADLAGLLSDHLHCERKAAENALGLVRRYPHDRDFVDAMARLGHEETSHVVQVAALMAELGFRPRADSANHYARSLFAQVRGTEPERRLDLVLCAGFIEARSHERLRLLEAGFSTGGEHRLADFYRALANAEERHAEIFIELARDHTGPDVVARRLLELGAHEAAIIAGLPRGARIH